MSLVLLAGAILMTRTLVNLEHQNFGIATANRYVLHFDPAGAGYTIDRLPGLYRQMEDRFTALPGVTGVGMALYSPLEGDNWGDCVIQQGHPAPRPGDKCGSSWDRVSPHFLDSIGVPIVRGRGIHRTPGHAVFSAGGGCQSDFRRTVSFPKGPHRPAFRHRRGEVFRELSDCWCVCRLQAEQSARRCAAPVFIGLLLQQLNGGFQEPVTRIRVKRNPCSSTRWFCASEHRRRMPTN